MELFREMPGYRSSSASFFFLTSSPWKDPFFLPLHLFFFSLQRNGRPADPCFLVVMLTHGAPPPPSRIFLLSKGGGFPCRSTRLTAEPLFMRIGLFPLPIFVAVFYNVEKRSSPSLHWLYSGTFIASGSFLFSFALILRVFSLSPPRV